MEYIKTALILCILIPIQAQQFVNLDRVLKAVSETASSKNYDQYVIDYCAEAAQLVVTINSLNYASGEVVFAYASDLTFPNKYNYTKGWTTDRGTDYPTSNFTVNYAGNPLFLSIIASEGIDQATYSIIISKIHKDKTTQSPSKTQNKNLLQLNHFQEKPFCKACVKQQNTIKYLFQTFESLVSGNVKGLDYAFYSFNVCKRALPPSFNIMLRTVLLGDEDWFAFTQYLSIFPNVTARSYIPDCADTSRDTPSYMMCDHDFFVTKWNFANMPEKLYLAIRTWASGVTVQTTFKLGTALFYVPMQLEPSSP